MFLFMVYLITLSVSQVLLLLVVGWWVIMKWKRLWSCSSINYRYYP